MGMAPFRNSTFQYNVFIYKLKTKICLSWNLASLTKEGIHVAIIYSKLDG